jgi:hypothetical protein
MQQHDASVRCSGYITVLRTRVLHAHIPLLMAPSQPRPTVSCRLHAGWSIQVGQVGATVKVNSSSCATHAQLLTPSTLTNFFASCLQHIMM